MHNLTWAQLTQDKIFANFITTTTKIIQ